MKRPARGGPVRVCGAGYRRRTIARIAATRATSAAAIIGYSARYSIDRLHRPLACRNRNSGARLAIRSGRTGQARGLRARPKIERNNPLGVRLWFAHSVVSLSYRPMLKRAATRPGTSATAASRSGSASAAPIPAAIRMRAKRARISGSKPTTCNRAAQLAARHGADCVGSLATAALAEIVP